MLLIDGGRGQLSAVRGVVKGKRVIVQGWGNVAAAAGYYLSKEGALVVGIIDRHGGAIQPKGFTADEVRDLFVGKDGNALRMQDMLPFEEVNERVWDVGAEIFLPCAASRLVSRDQVDVLLARMEARVVDRLTNRMLTVAGIGLAAITALLAAFT